MILNHVYPEITLRYIGIMEKRYEIIISELEQRSASYIYIKFVIFNVNACIYGRK